MAFPLIHHIRTRVRARHVVESVEPPVAVIVCVFRFDVVVAVILELRITGRSLATSIKEKGVVQFRAVDSIPSRLLVRQFASRSLR